MTQPRSSPRINPSFAGRESFQKDGILERSVGQRLDSSGDRVGVQTTLGGSAGSSQGYSTAVQATGFTGGLSGVRSGDFRIDSEGGYRGNCTVTVVPRLLWSPVLRSQGFWGVPPGPRFVPSERVSQEDSLSHGNSVFHTGCHSPGRLGNVSGPQRRVLSCVDPPSVPQVAQIRVEGQDFPVQGPPIRAQPRSMGVYPYHAGSMHCCPFTGHQTTSFSGRLADSGCQPVSQQQPFPRVGQPSSRSGLHTESEKVCPHSRSVIHFSGDEIRLGYNVGPPDPREDKSFLVPSGQASLSQPLLSPVTSCSSRDDGVTSTVGSAWACPQEGTAAAVPEQVEPSKAAVGRQHPTRWVASESCSAVDVELMAPTGSPHLPSRPSGRDVHRRVHNRLGRSCGRSDGLGPLVPGLAGPAYQLSGNAGSLSSSQRLCTVSERQSCSTVYGQYDSSMLHQQRGGVSLGYSLSRSRVPPPPLPNNEHCSEGKTYSREGEHSSRLFESSRDDSADRVDSCSLSTSTSMVSLAQTSSGFVRHAIQQKASDLCVSSSRPDGPGDRRSVHELGRPIRLCVPSGSDPQQGDQEGQTRQSLPNSHSSNVASPAMVPRASRAIKTASTQTERRKKGSSATQIRHSTPKPSQNVPSRLAGVRKRMRSLGASRQLCDLVSRAHRSGTNSVYSSHWKRWVGFCTSKGISPSNPSEVQLANFLAYLSHDCKLSASSVRVYRAAICTTLRQLGSKSFPGSSLLRDLVRGASLKEARTPKRLPAWDLFLVLASLREVPYEPLFSSDLKSLTCKTVFLIALASGRRASEVCNFSGLAHDIAVLQDGSYMLKFLPEFLAKNQDPADPSPSIRIRPLTSFLCPDDPDRKLCPVRALKRYLKFTRSLRQNQRKLFISFNPYYTKDISTSSISRWVKLVIKSAYATSDVEYQSARSHEIRAWAASTAFLHTQSLRDVLEAAYWRSESPFINYYLRDASLTRGDGTRGLSFVAAQQVVMSRRA